MVTSLGATKGLEARLTPGMPLFFLAYTEHVSPEILVHNDMTALSCHRGHDNAAVTAICWQSITRASSGWNISIKVTL